MRTAGETIRGQFVQRIAATPPGVCAVEQTQSILKVCHTQSCGKCVPCRDGLGMLRAIGDGDYPDCTGKRVIVIGGGGEPIHDGLELAGERAQNLYSLDRKNSLRFSHENPAIIAAYEDYFEKPLSHKAHGLLHTDHDAWKMPGER